MNSTRANMNKLHESLVNELQATAGIYEASVLISEVRFILRGADTTHIRCRIWYDLAQQEYRYELSHELPNMVASGTVWAGSPRAALALALERITESQPELMLVENPFFDDPNDEEEGG